MQSPVGDDITLAVIVLSSIANYIILANIMSSPVAAA